MKKSILLTWMCACLSFFGFAQASLDFHSSDCHTLKANLFSKEKEGPLRFTFLLEKEIKTGLWQKVKAIEQAQAEATFSAILPGNYRVSILDNAWLHQRRDPQDLSFNTAKPAPIILPFPDKAVVSNTLIVPDTKDCEPKATARAKSIRIPAGNLLTFYPNPVADLLTVDWKDELAEEAEILLYSPLGQLLQSIPVQDRYTTLDLEALPTGLYLLLVVQAQEHLASHKIYKL